MDTEESLVFVSAEVAADKEDADEYDALLLFPGQGLVVHIAPVCVQVQMLHRSMLA